MSELIELFEYTPKKIPAEVLSTETAQVIWEKYKDQISIDLPSFQTDNQVPIALLNEPASITGNRKSPRRIAIATASTPAEVAPPMFAY